MTRLPAEFRRRRGYDLMSRLPELFSASPAFSRTRHDYWRTVTELFSEAYCQQIARWCERHGLELTGHMLCEQEFENEIPVGGAAMPSLAHMHRPGIDILREQTHEVLTCKQASSIAHQFGRPRTLSETYGTSGWHFTFEAQKWSGDWQTVLGINTRCQHLTPYSIRGISWHQPWWKYFRTVEDYFARATFFTSIGRPLRDILLLHNISSAWAGPPTDEDRHRKGERLRLIAEDLLALHYDFDLGDEMVISRHGRVKGRRLLVGRAAYRLVVVPECDTIFRSTADLLRCFLRAGGRVLCLGRRPAMIEGKPAPELEALFAHPNVTTIAAKRDELEDALRALLPRRVSITGEAGRQAADVIYHARTDRGRTYVMLANRHRETGQRVTVELAGEGRVEQWDLETGGARALAARAAGGKTVVALDLPPTGSAALVLDPKRRPSARQPSPRLLPVAVRGEEMVVRDAGLPRAETAPRRDGPSRHITPRHPPAMGGSCKAEPRQTARGGTPLHLPRESTAGLRCGPGARIGRTVRHLRQRRAHLQPSARLVAGQEHGPGAPLRRAAGRERTRPPLRVPRRAGIRIGGVLPDRGFRGGPWH